MKLILAIVNNDDSAVVSATLTKENYSVTKLSTFHIHILCFSLREMSLVILGIL